MEKVCVVGSEMFPKVRYKLLVKMNILSARVKAIFDLKKAELVTLQLSSQSVKQCHAAHLWQQKQQQ